MLERSIGSVFAGYRIDRVIGRGGMGVVYLATQVALDRLVALKLVAPELGAEATFRERFARELKFVAAIDHPNVIPVYDARSEDGMLFIAMRYVDGTDLRELLLSEGPLEPRRAVSIFEQVADALDAVHELGVVHRDVKPANVLIGRRRGVDHVYLTDFGLSKHTTSGFGMTAPGQWVGTVDYVPPEQILGQTLDLRTDIYALGCVLYEVLTGQVPYPKEGDAAKLWAHMNDDPPAPSAVRGELPEALDDVVARALAKQPGDRWASAGELAAAARAALAPATPTATGGIGPESGEQATRISPLPESSAGGSIPGVAEPVSEEGATRRAGPPTVQPQPSAPAPQPSAPQPSAPQPAAPQPSAPQPAAPQPSAPQPAAPQPSAPQPAAPQPAAPLSGEEAPPTVRVDPVSSPPAPPAAPPSDAAGGRAGEAPPPAVAEPARAPSAGGQPWWRRAPVLIGAVVLVAVIAAAALLLGGGGAGGGLTTSTVAVGRAPAGVAADGNAVWVANNGDDTITRITGAGKAESPIAAGRSPEGVAVGEGAVWVTNTAGALTRIDPSAGRADESTIRLPTDPYAVAAGAGTVWVANGLDNSVTAIDPETRQVGDGEPIPVGRSPYALAVGGDTVWVANFDAGTVSRIGTESFETEGEAIRVGRGPSAIAIDGDTVWVANAEANSVSRIDAGAGRVVGSAIAVGTNPSAIAVGLDAVWVANANDNTVTQLDSANGKVVGEPIAVGEGPGGIAVAGGAVWVANSGSNNMTKIEP